MRQLLIDGSLALGFLSAVFAGGVWAHHRVIKIKPEGGVETVLKSERPWSPTGVAIHGRDVYILEYTIANGPATEGWRPRVRKLSQDGKISTLATIPDKAKKQEP